MNIKKYLVIIFYFILFSLTVYSQSAVLVLDYFEIEDEKLRTEISDQIQKQLTEELERVNLEYRDDSFVASAIRDKGLGSRQLIEEVTALELGRAADVPVVITVSAIDKTTFLEFVITAWGIESEKVSRSSVTGYIMINSSIAQIVKKLTGEYGIDSIPQELKVRKITFISNQEGMEIYMPDGELLGEITFSILNVTDREFDIGTKLLITKKLKGYREADQYIYLGREKTAVPLSDLKEVKSLALEFNYTFPQLMGAGSGIRFYPVPDWMFLSFDSYFYLQKDFSSPYGNEMTHSDFRFLAGIYIGFGPESLFRVNVSTGLGIILSYPLDRGGVYTDFYINALNITLELNFDDWSYYLRPELRFGIELGDNNLFDGKLFLSEVNVPVITLGVLRKW
ncbi:MAG: hypothetical protein JEY91_07820 [Spirochaetaceae bacterium]|nr:hypothetical protein [Spirochaetaceae bacterium]